MKILKCSHVTATERKHLKVFLASGMTTAKVNTKYYEMLSGTPKGDQWIFKIRISTPEKNDYGKTVYQHQTITVLN